MKPRNSLVCFGLTEFWFGVWISGVWFQSLVLVGNLSWVNGVDNLFGVRGSNETRGSRLGVGGFLVCELGKSPISIKSLQIEGMQNAPTSQPTHFAKSPIAVDFHFGDFPFGFDHSLDRFMKEIVRLFQDFIY